MASVPVEQTCDIAMDRAIMLARQAEMTTDPAARYASAQLAQTYVSMARELRLGLIKSRRYNYVDTPGIPPVLQEPENLNKEGRLPQPPFEEATG